MKLFNIFNVFKKANRIQKIRNFTDTFSTDGFIEFSTLLESLQLELNYLPEEMTNIKISCVYHTAAELVSALEVGLNNMKNGCNPRVTPVKYYQGSLYQWLSAPDGGYYNFADVVKLLIKLSREFQDALDVYAEGKMETSIARAIHFQLTALQQLVMVIAAKEFKMEFEVDNE